MLDSKDDAGKGWGKRRRGWKRVKWLDSITDSMNMSLSRLWVMVKDRETWYAAVHGVAKTWTRLSVWTMNDNKRCVKHFPKCVMFINSFNEVWTLVCGVNPIIILTVQMGKLRHREVKLIMQFTQSEWRRTKVLGYIQDSVHGVRNTVETFQSLNIKIKTPQSHVRFQERKPKAHPSERWMDFQI